MTPDEPPSLEQMIANGQAVCSIEAGGHVLNMGRATAYKYAASGDLPGVRRVGNKLMVSVPELARFLGVEVARG